MVLEDGSELRWVRPPQQARSQQTLERILDAAEAMVSEKGFEDSTVSAIVQRANSSVGAFYARFEDKHALLHALSDRFVLQAMLTADEALDPERWERSSIPAILHSVVRFLVSIYRARAGLMRAFVIRNHTDPGFGERQDRLSNYVNDRVTELLLARSQEIPSADPESVIRFGLMFVFSTLDSALLFGDLRSSQLNLSDDDFGAELTRAFLAYLGVDDE
jgi:AcrR family transcriptional regulator